jgi:hypothetical protein
MSGRSPETAAQVGAIFLAVCVAAFAFAEACSSGTTPICGPDAGCGPGPFSDAGPDTGDGPSE